MTVIELAIAPGQAAGLFRVEVVRSPAGEASAEVGLDVEALLARREQLEHAVLASAVVSRAILPQIERPLREVGQALFSVLLGSGDVAGRYRASAALATERGQGLRVVLRVDSPALAGLPWEAMYDAASGGYVCRRDQLVRHVPVPSVASLTVQPPLRILGIVSSPRGLQPLDVEKEQEQLTRALARPRAEGLIEVHWTAEATWAALQDLLLSGQWHVVHFIGHGDFDISRDEGVLALTRDDGRADLVEADRLVDLLHEARPMPRLVVLNACSGGATGVNDLFAGTASALVRGGVSAVAAMQYPISDVAACAFARGFYTAIAHGRGVDDATSSGRVAILGTHARTLEWVTPVMYLRGHESRLFILHQPSPSGPVADLEPAVPTSNPAEPVPVGEAHAVGWSWETYATQLNVPSERIDVGQRLVAEIMTAVRDRGLPWQVVMRKGYVAVQRPGGYNVLVVDLYWNRVPRLAAKIPAEPTTLGLTSPFPQLPEVWTPAEREWGWTVAAGTPLPDVGALIDLIRPFQPTQGPMTTPARRATVTSDNAVRRVEISSLTLGRALGSGGQGQVVAVENYLIDGKWPAALKTYNAAVSLNAAGLEKIVAFPDQLHPNDRDWLMRISSWPWAIAMENGTVRGFLMRTVPDAYFFSFKTVTQGSKAMLSTVEFLLNPDNYVRRLGISISEKDRLNLLGTLAESMSRLHALGIVIGGVSPKNLLFNPNSYASCFIIDCDAIVLHGESALEQVDTIDWEVPPGEQKGTEASDSYKFGLLAIRLFARDQSAQDTSALSALSPELGKLARLSQDLNPLNRPTPGSWAGAIQKPPEGFRMAMDVV